MRWVSDRERKTKHVGGMAGGRRPARVGGARLWRLDVRQVAAKDAGPDPVVCNQPACAQGDLQAAAGQGRTAL